MEIFRSLKSWFGASRANDFYGQARKLRRVPAAELAVAEAALSGGGPVAERFVAQLRDAPAVWRRIGDDGTYELRVSTSNQVRGVPRPGWRSRQIPVRGQPGDRRLELELYVSMAGIVELHGRTLDEQPWPASWHLGEGDLALIRANAPWITLPSPARIREQRALAVEVIEAWLGEPDVLHGTRGMVVAAQPATTDAIVAFEETHAFPLPPAYRELLLVADGVEIGSLVLLGTDDAYRLDMPGPDRLIITPPNEDGAFVLASNGEVRFVGFGEETSDGRLRAPDVREWVRRHVRPRPKA